MTGALVTGGISPAPRPAMLDAAQTRCTVLARHATKLARLTSDERELIETITTQLVGNLVHAPTLELRRQAPERRT